MQTAPSPPPSAPMPLVVRLIIVALSVYAVVNVVGWHWPFASEPRKQAQPAQKPRPAEPQGQARTFQWDNPVHFSPRFVIDAACVMTLTRENHHRRNSCDKVSAFLGGVEVSSSGTHLVCRDRSQCMLWVHCPDGDVSYAKDVRTASEIIAAVSANMRTDDLHQAIKLCRERAPPEEWVQRFAAARKLHTHQP